MDVNKSSKDLLTVLYIIIWFITMMYWRISSTPEILHHIQPKLPRTFVLDNSLYLVSREPRTCCLDLSPMDPSGFEPETSCFLYEMQGRRSTDLSYRPRISRRLTLFLILYFNVSDLNIKIKKGGDPAVGSPTATL